MGYFPVESIGSAGEFLLHFLRHNPDGTNSSPYSNLYDGTEERHKELTDWVGFESDFESPELAIDLAAEQLEEAGLLEKTPLENPLSDGEPDYMMTLTPEGLVFLDDYRPFPFHGVML